MQTSASGNWESLRSAAGVQQLQQEDYSFLTTCMAAASQRTKGSRAIRSKDSVAHGCLCPSPGICPGRHGQPQHTGERGCQPYFLATERPQKGLPSGGPAVAQPPRHVVQLCPDLLQSHPELLRSPSAHDRAAATGLVQLVIQAVKAKDLSLCRWHGIATVVSQCHKMNWHHV